MSLGLAVMVSMLAGCHGGLSIPPDWTDAPAVSSVDAPAGGRLQVILCFGTLFSDHSALRLESAGHEPILWDPGGLYAITRPEAKRSRDVVHAHVPTVQEWWTFRRDGVSEAFNIVYEWRLAEETSRRMYDVLSGHSGDFDTGAAGGACSLAVSKFLQHHAGDVMDVPKRWFMPHNLARHLWTQNPDCVYVFERGSPDRRLVRNVTPATTVQ